MQAHAHRHRLRSSVPDAALRRVRRPGPLSRNSATLSLIGATDCSVRKRIDSCPELLSGALSASRHAARAASRDSRKPSACCSAHRWPGRRFASSSAWRARNSSRSLSTCSSASARLRAISSSLPTHSRSANRASWSSRATALSTERASRSRCSWSRARLSAESSRLRWSSASSAHRSSSICARASSSRSASLAAQQICEVVLQLAAPFAGALHRLAELQDFDLLAMELLLASLQLAAQLR